MLTWIAALLPSQLDLDRVEFDVQGTTRTAMVHRPKSIKGAPVVFVFHGHGGNGRQVSRSYRMHAHWPGALIIYPNGLPTKTPNDPEGKRPGWEITRDPYDNKDLKFFDVMMDWAKKQGAKAERVYVTGHSNGGFFSYILWENRASKLAAVAPSAAVFGPQREISTSLPFFAVVGDDDPLVDTNRQLAGIERAKALNSSKTSKTKGKLTIWEGKNPAVVYHHKQGHRFPADAGQMIADFFKSVR